MNSKQKNSVLGVLVADAAALGLHWLYDLERIHQVVGDGDPCFSAPDAKNYEGQVGYFAHADKFAGEQSHYGESYLLNLRHLSEQGSFKTQIFQQDFIATFGPGGSYCGYIDSPTRQSLHNLQAIDLTAEPDSNTKPSGADDHQIPALTPVSALCAYHPAEQLNDTEIEDAIRVTNNNALAVKSGLYFSKVLRAVLDGSSITDSFANTIDHAPDELKEKLSQAINLPTTDLDEAAALFGQVCGLEETMPLSAYILLNGASYQQAIEMNILAGGDSCGRSVLIGAIAGAYYGLGEEDGIPHSWLLRLSSQLDIADILA